MDWMTGSTPGRGSYGIFLFTTSTVALGPTQPPVQWVPEALVSGVKWLECEADFSPPSGAEAKNAWSYTSTHQMSSWHCI
jgi:hypothetical protein